MRPKQSRPGKATFLWSLGGQVPLSAQGKRSGLELRREKAVARASPSFRQGKRSGLELRRAQSVARASPSFRPRKEAAALQPLMSSINTLPSAQHVLSHKEYCTWKERIWPSRERKARSHSLYKIALALISNISQ